MSNSLSHSSDRQGSADKQTALDPPVYTVAEFCASHRVSRSALYKLWAAGTGPRFKRIGVKVLHRPQRPPPNGASAMTALRTLRKDAPR